MENLTARVTGYTEFDEIQRRDLLRTAFIAVLSPSAALLTASCGGGGTSGSSSLEVAQVSGTSAPIFANPVEITPAEITPVETVPDQPTNTFPKNIVVSIAPYTSIQGALDAETVIDWQRDSARAQAITLAYAARELQVHLKLMGIEATIFNIPSAPKEPSFVLGIAGKLTSTIETELAISYQALGTDGYAITPVNNSVYITAGDRVGVLNGVYKLLDHLGVTWFDPYETQVTTTQIATTQTVWPTLRELPRTKFRGFWIYGDEFVPDEFAVWMGRNRLNIGGRARWHIKNKLGLKYWGGEHTLLQQEFSKPGLFALHPDWFALINDVRRPVVESGDYFNPSFGNVDAANYFADRMIERLESGDLKEIDILNIWPSDNRFNNFDQSPLAKALGNETDNLLHLCAVMREKFQAATLDGRLSRNVVIAGISYFLTMQAPTNRSIISRLEPPGYLHLFYPIERSWAGKVDANLVDRDTNRKFINDLASWSAIAKLDYGIVEYHNFSAYAGVCLTDTPYLAHNFEVTTSERNGLFAYMHPLLANPGPRRLTNHLLAKMAWRSTGVAADVVPNDLTQKWAINFYERRYGKMATSWREVSDLMAHSVENAKELFGINSLYWLLFQTQIWGAPFYTVAETAQLIGLFRAGGPQKLPGRFSGLDTINESFLGLDESIRIQQLAQSKWQLALASTSDFNILAHMESDIAWFKATISRYRLMALTCDFQLATGGSLEAPRLKQLMQAEIDFLQNSAATKDTLSPVNQRGFLDVHRKILVL